MQVSDRMPAGDVVCSRGAAFVCAPTSLRQVLNVIAGPLHSTVPAHSRARHLVQVPQLLVDGAEGELRRAPAAGALLAL